MPKSYFHKCAALPALHSSNPKPLFQARQQSTQRRRRSRHWFAKTILARTARDGKAAHKHCQVRTLSPLPQPRHIVFTYGNPRAVPRYLLSPTPDSCLSHKVKLLQRAAELFFLLLFSLSNNSKFIFIIATYERLHTFFFTPTCLRF